MNIQGMLHKSSVRHSRKLGLKETNPFTERLGNKIKYIKNIYINKFF